MFDHEKGDLMSKELTHYGILGMKWGVRRYQNYDGTLTEAGKSRRINGVAKGSPMTAEEADSGNCNPNKPDRWYDPEEYKTQMAEKGGYLYNCQNCAVTYESRVRGYDVVAASRSNNPTADMIQDDISKAFIDPTTGKPPIVKKFDCDVSEAKVNRFNELWSDDDFYSDPKKGDELDKIFADDSKNRSDVDGYVTDTIKPGERYLVKTKTFDYDTTGDYREHYLVVDWTNSKEPLAIETQSTWSDPDTIPMYQSDANKRHYVESFGTDDGLLLGIELTRVDNCDLNYDVVEKVTERSKR